MRGHLAMLYRGRALLSLGQSALVLKLLNKQTSTHSLQLVLFICIFKAAQSLDRSSKASFEVRCIAWCISRLLWHCMVFRRTA